MAEAQGTAPAGFVAEPVVVRTETRWRCIMAGMLGIRLAVGVLTGVFQALHPLRHSESVDPATRHLGGAFVESNLGSAVAPDGVVTVRMIAHQYLCTPQRVTVPVGTLVRFRLTSPDVTHGVMSADTHANAMSLPGVGVRAHDALRSGRRVRDAVPRPLRLRAPRHVGPCGGGVAGPGPAPSAR